MWRVLAEYDPDSRGGRPRRRPKGEGGHHHWVDAATALDAEVRLYDNLFSDPEPDAGDKNFLDCLNPSSLEVLEGCKLEASLAVPTRRDTGSRSPPPPPDPPDPGGFPQEPVQDQQTVLSRVGTVVGPSFFLKDMLLLQLPGRPIPVEQPDLRGLPEHFEVDGISLGRHSRLGGDQRRADSHLPDLPVPGTRTTRSSSTSSAGIVSRVPPGTSSAEGTPSTALEK